MKKLKLTINGEVKTFNLPENGEYKCEVEEHYVPKVGDCARVECRNTWETTFYWFKIKEVVNAMADFSLAVKEDLKISKNGFFSINDNRIYTQITPEELKAKYAEAGYDWDYEMDTVEPIKWIPKDGDTVWYLTDFLEVSDTFYYGDVSNNFLVKGLFFQTEAECQKFADHCLRYFDKTSCNSKAIL